MKIACVSLIVLLVAACASAPAPNKAQQARVASDYSAKPRADGSIDITVHSRVAMTRKSEVDFPLGDTLNAAAAKECPNGYDLQQDELPTTHTRRSGVLVAELHGVVRCK